MVCNGNSTEYCGGPNRLNVYDYNNAVTVSSSSSATSASASASATASTAATGWSYTGCYNDPAGNARTLPNAIYGGASTMTPAQCQTSCKAAGYTISGTEYSGECYCSNTIPAGTAKSTQCTMACNGDATKICGGPNALSVYTFGAGVSSSSSSTSPTASPSTSSAATSGWVSQGCYSDDVNDRSLGTAIYGYGSTNSIEVCTAQCKKGGFTLAGVEYGGECYCDNKLGADSVKSTACNMACSGDATETCGGPGALNLYKYVSGTASSTTTPTSSTTSSTPSSVATIPAGWAYQGCYIDGANGRDLTLAQQADSATLTVESCIAYCVGKGYVVAGMEYSQQCFCDNFIRNGAAKTTESKCNMPCGGNANENCGAGNIISIYSKGDVQVYQPPQPQKTDLPGSWKYVGCLMDDAEGRTFPYQLILSNNNTAKNCLSQCQAFGYGAAGMEYSDECYCGDAQNAVDLNRGLAAETDCNMPCTGNASYICGAGDRITYYTWQGTTDLTKWAFPAGNAAGAYQFLIGGVVIPLVTQQTITGKVTFLEKSGTGAPNTTGAYELDLAQLSNFTGAWRPMHVKSDVFCSASLTLPDKAGRQINVGGWANDATYGVRLYWPDGKPGTWGVNDWQENVNQVSLQIGRWYPTAMVMANGSILVMGGEQGSNGAPVPSLEVLPKPAGGYVKFCDYLNRTDPYNLYPFLAVLPTSGDIFVAYYNEARILDAKTLDVKKVLPNIPGAVNDFLGGRTYPFEGTAMLLPQSPPYTDLAVIICGGSVPGPEVALDNCVTIHPEAADPEWVVERMVSTVKYFTDVTGANSFTAFKTCYLIHDCSS
jgi:Glyoxal oxidase N-terminus/WSC domain